MHIQDHTVVILALKSFLLVFIRMFAIAFLKKSASTTKNMSDAHSYIMGIIDCACVTGFLMMVYFRRHYTTIFDQHSEFESLPYNMPDGGWTVPSLIANAVHYSKINSFLMSYAEFSKLLFDWFDPNDPTPMTPNRQTIRGFELINFTPNELQPNLHVTTCANKTRKCPIVLKFQHKQNDDVFKYLVVVKGMVFGITKDKCFPYSTDLIDAFVNHYNLIKITRPARDVWIFVPKQHGVFANGF